MHVRDGPQEMARLMQHPRVYAFLHMPVQAASNAVLGAMRRQYTIEDFCLVVDQLRAKARRLCPAALTGAGAGPDDRHRHYLRLSRRDGGRLCGDRCPDRAVPVPRAVHQSGTTARATAARAQAGSSMRALARRRR